MKIFSIFMTVLLLAIGFVPCKDGKDMSKGKVKTELTADQHHDDDTHHEDGCSPFCVCACCSLQSVHASILHFIPAANLLVTEYDLPGTDDVQELSRPIWQPPKLTA
jgi:hypothetical protein